MTKQATHFDDCGNFYRVVGDKAREFCVDYWSKSRQAWLQDLGKDFSHLIPINRAYGATQCKAPTGETGTFLFSHKNDNGYVLVSPVFNGWADLSLWMQANGWKSVGGLNGWFEKI